MFPPCSYIQSSVSPPGFNPDETESLSLEGIKEEILPLFPDIQARGLGLQFKYRDSFAGTIVLETNGDVQVRKYSLALVV